MNRIYHTWDEWECFPAGFYNHEPPTNMTRQQATLAYRDFLADLPQFEQALSRVLTEWPNSVEHYLSNPNMNRIAWLGQASACIALGLSHMFRGGFNLLNAEQKQAANLMALKYLNRWLASRGESELTLETAQSRTEMDLY